MPERPFGSGEAASRASRGPDVLRVLWERKLLIALATIAAIGASLVLSQAAEKEYTSDSELLLRDPGFAKTLFGADLFEASIDPEREASTQIAVIRSPAVTQRVARRIRSSQPIEDLRRTIEVTPNENSDVITVSATTTSRARSAAIANAFAGEYIAYQRELDRRKVQDAQRLVQDNLNALPPENTAERAGLQQSLKQLKVLEALQTGNADVVAVARPPDEQSAPKPLRNAVLAGVLGLLLGTGLALIADFLDRRLKSAADFEHAFGYPVLVTIPQRAVANTVGGELTQAQAEPYRMLREGLRFLDISGAGRCLLITSPDAGEGKTTVAVNLARTLIAGGDRVLIIEADLRRPAAMRQLGVETDSVGLVGALVAQATLDSVIAEVNPSLHVVPTGPTPPNPADVLRSVALAQIIAEAKGRYDAVIVDAPPLLPVSDTRVLLDLASVDGVLVVGRMNSSRRDRAGAARRILEQSAQPVLGVVVTGGRLTMRDYYYYEPIGANGGRRASPSPGESTVESIRDA